MTSPPHLGSAAVTVLRVAPLMLALSCSAITSNGHFWFSLDHFGFVLEFVTRAATSATLTPAPALGGARSLSGLEARSPRPPEVFRLDGVQRLFLAFMMLGSVT